MFAIEAVKHVYEVRPSKDHRGTDLISDVLPFGRLWYDRPNNMIGYVMHSSRSHDAVIRLYDETGNVIEDARAHWRLHYTTCDSSNAFY